MSIRSILISIASAGRSKEIFPIQNIFSRPGASATGSMKYYKTKKHAVNNRQEQSFILENNRRFYPVVDYIGDRLSGNRFLDVEKEFQRNKSAAIRRHRLSPCQFHPSFEERKAGYRGHA